MKLLAAFILLVGLIAIAGAVPTVSTASDVTSNGFNVSLSGVTGTDCWVMWGGIPGGENWVTPNSSASGGAANIQIIGSPIFGGELIYYYGCDPTGCGNEQSVTIATITPNPTTTWGVPLRNITRNRFAINTIVSGLQSPYTQVAPFAIVTGFGLLMFGVGIWFRTKSVRMFAILTLLIAPFVLSGGQGLYLGVIFNGIFMVEMLFAAMLSGILFMLTRN